MILTIILSTLGLVDSIYLTWKHYSNVIPHCTIHPFIPSFLIDCGKVLTSPYSTMFGIPLALFGIIHYSILFILFFGSIYSKNKIYRYLVILQTIIGAIASLFFMYIQIGIIKSICLYCTLSALISFTLLIIIYRLLKKERYELHLAVFSFIYQAIFEPIFFLLDPENIHNLMISFGNYLSKTLIIKFIGSKFIYKDKSLKQNILGINFENPVGLAAGFDYNADLTQTLYYLGFGFQSVGTITNLPYEGNPQPRLGRLPKSKSLMVNKGFKNLGAKIISEKLKKLKFKIPLGISIGITNSNKIKTLKDAIKDIINAFKTFEKTKIKNSYYEFNISCPNLINNNVNFYKTSNLNKLLQLINQLKLKKPIFVKMPIEKTNLIQLITGMIFQGPQLITQINLGLIDSLKKEGFNNIKQVVGKDIK